MKNTRTPTKDEQKRIEVCENVVNWASEDRKHRGCIIIATNEESSTCAVIGQGQSLITALVASIRDTPSLKSILTTALMVEMTSGSLESDTDKD